MFFLFVSVKSELWMNVLPTCTGIVALIKPPTWENSIYQNGKFFRASEAQLSTNDEWQLSIHTFCWGSRYTEVSFSAKKKSKLYFRWTKLCLHIYTKGKDHFLSVDKSHKLTLRTLILNKEGVKKDREYYQSNHLCKILLEVLIISFCLISRALSWKTKKSSNWSIISSS